MGCSLVVLDVSLELEQVSQNKQNFLTRESFSNHVRNFYKTSKLFDPIVLASGSFEGRCTCADKT